MTDDLAEKLLAIASERSNAAPPDVLESISEPEWENISGRDWEMYVCRDLRDLWSSLDAGPRLVAFIGAVDRLNDGMLREMP